MFESTPTRYLARMARNITLAVGDPGGSPLRTLPDNSPCLVLRSPRSGERYDIAPWCLQGRGYSFMPRDVLNALRAGAWDTYQAWESSARFAAPAEGAAWVVSGAGRWLDAVVARLADVPARSHVLVWMATAPEWARIGPAGVGWALAAVEASPTLDIESDRGLNPVVDGVPLPGGPELFELLEVQPGGGFAGGGRSPFEFPEPPFAAYGFSVRAPYRVRPEALAGSPPPVALRWEPTSTGAGLVDVYEVGLPEDIEAMRVSPETRASMIDHARAAARSRYGAMLGL